MNAHIRKFLPLAGVSCLAAWLLGCDALPLGNPKPPLAPAQGSYFDVPFAKFVSGLYVDEFTDKYVRIDCTFFSQAASVLPGGYAPDRYLAFAASAPEGVTAPTMLTVVVPREMADTVFALKSGEALVVSGRAFGIVVTQLTGKTYRDLALEAQKIEKTH